MIEVMQQLQNWYQQPLGQMVGHQIRQHLDLCLPKLFGYHLLHLGISEQCGWLAASPILHRITLTPEWLPETNLVASVFELPLAENSIDLAILPHTLAFCPDPNLVLAEVNRVLVPEGHMIFIGFNALSLWGIWRLWRRYTHQAPWNGRFSSMMSAQRCLREMGYQITYGVSFFHRPPFQSQKLLNCLEFLETMGQLSITYPGGIYLLVARKKVSTLMPIKPIWRFKNFVLGRRLIQPTTKTSY